MIVTLKTIVIRANQVKIIDNFLEKKDKNDNNNVQDLV